MVRLILYISDQSSREGEIPSVTPSPDVIYLPVQEGLFLYAIQSIQTGNVIVRTGTSFRGCGR
jgi:hypothetical protein